jgi:hypothetical protein
LHKKDGGIRPIAVGCTFRRLIAKVACRRIQQNMGELLRPQQFGFGTKGGAEAIVHVVRKYVTSRSSSPRVLVKLDFKNAFNSIFRDNMLEQVRCHAPELYPFLHQCYRDPTYLTYGMDTIFSDSGCQQGDPLGPLLFCLAIQPVIKHLTSTINTWYMDDGTLAGEIDQVLQDVGTVLACCSSTGLELNTTKCEAYLINHTFQETIETASLLQTCLPGIKILHPEGLTLLGAPLTDEAIPIILESKIKAAQILTSRLCDLNAHPALFVLRNCLAIPKMMYTLRTSGCFNHRSFLRRFDEEIRRKVESITNCDLNGLAGDQSSLPVKYGGIGIRHTEELALPAFLASVHSVKGLTDVIYPQGEDDLLTEAVRLWKDRGLELPEPSMQHSQSAWDRVLLERLAATFKDSLTDVQQKARFQSLIGQEAGAWLNAIPSPQLGTFLDNDTLRVAVGLRLGSDICHPHVCVCGATVAATGLHGLSCKRSAGRWSRHHALNETIRRALETAGIPSRLEPPGTSRDDGKRPDGMTLFPWKHGKSMVWDATCVDNLSKTNLARTLQQPGSAASAAERKKLKKYQSLSARYIVVPLGFETLGHWGTEALSLLRAIGHLMVERTFEPRASEYLWQRLSVAIQRGNAASVLGTVSSSKSLSEVYYL